MCQWGGEIALHSSSTVASSTTAMSTSEGRGIARCLLPHIFREYICDVAVFFGGGRIAHRPSSSQCRHVPRRKRERPSSSQCQRVPRRRRGRPSSSHCRCALRREGDRLPTSLTLTSASSEGGKPVPDLACATTIRIALVLGRHVGVVEKVEPHLFTYHGWLDTV